MLILSQHISENVWKHVRDLVKIVLSTSANDTIVTPNPKENLQVLLSVLPALEKIKPAVCMHFVILIFLPAYTFFVNSTSCTRFLRSANSTALVFTASAKSRANY